MLGLKLIAVLLLTIAFQPVKAAEPVAATTETCLRCHSAEFSEPIHAMLSTAHWNEENPDAPVSQLGCQSCHGLSTGHADIPTQIQPDISYGPKWTNPAIEQNDTCLACHEATTHTEWRVGRHAQENLTCVACHDAHVEEDPVRMADQQAQICTVCHKVQKEAIHGISGHEAEPNCSRCHDPHTDPSPGATLLSSRSEGCRACHDLQQMSLSTTVSGKANSYHKVMQRDDRTCIDCHQNLIHVDDLGLRAAVATIGQPENSLTLFYPGASDSEWLNSDHPGSQSLQQGSDCRQCHLGETAAMGVLLAPVGFTPNLPVTIKLDADASNLNLSISGVGGADSVAVMLDSGSSDEFSSSGCWASCHSDLPGMTRDRGQGLTKYLTSSRRQLRSVGRPAITHDADELAAMRADGQYLELWRASLDSSSRIETFSILESRRPDSEPRVSAQVARDGDAWTVTFTKPLVSNGKSISIEQDYTFGVAVHGVAKEGAEHWVSLPLTFGLDSKTADFRIVR